MKKYTKQEIKKIFINYAYIINMNVKDFNNMIKQINNDGRFK